MGELGDPFGTQRALEVQVELDLGQPGDGLKSGAKRLVDRPDEPWDAG